MIGLVGYRRSLTQYYSSYSPVLYRPLCVFDIYLKVFHGDISTSTLIVYPALDGAALVYALVLLLEARRRVGCNADA